ncbi:MAG: MerR family transcriptional regulator [Dehalococcoidia bacterium]|nr:MerR family transcriptional regulator [Dehalococcoidia bacterium]
MLKIGEFSRLSQTPVSTLRYYDDIGLLKPVSVDGFTGYRYYSADQLPTLNRITELKDLGLSLAEIVQLTGNGAGMAELRGALERQRAESVRVIETEHSRLQRLEAWLEKITRDTTMDTYEVSIKQVKPQLAVCLRRVVPTYHSEGELWQELCGFLTGVPDVRYAGPAMTLCYDGEYKEKDVDIEIAMPLAAPVPEHGDIRVRTVPGHDQVASVLHKGPFDTIHNAYAFMLQWLDRNHYRMAGPDRVVYLNMSENPAPEDILQEMQLPVTRN